MKVEWTSGVRTAFNNIAFVDIVRNALLHMPTRYTQFVWIRAKYIIYNQRGFTGLPVHDYGILSRNLATHKDLIAWWCTANDNYGYAIFHGFDWSTGAFRVVCLHTIQYFLNTNSNGFRC